MKAQLSSSRATTKQSIGDCYLCERWFSVAARGKPKGGNLIGLMTASGTSPDRHDKRADAFLVSGARGVFEHRACLDSSDPG
jgi:hypothetical protein